MKNTRRILCLLLSVCLLPFSLFLSACEDRSGKEYACFTLFEEITKEVTFPLYARITVDLRNAPLDEEESERLFALFEEFAKENDLHVFRYTLTEAEKEGYVTEGDEGTYSFLNGYHFCYGHGEVQEDGSLLFDVTYIWESTYNCFGAANAVLTPDGSGWELSSYDSWQGMVNP